MRQALLADPDHEPEIIDMETGHAYEPNATVDGRGESATKIGY